MAKEWAVPNRQYTLEFKVEAVRLAESVGGSQAARRLGIPDASIWNWIRLKRQGRLEVHSACATPVKRAVSELEAEVGRLRRALTDTKLDNEILKKATVRSMGQCNVTAEFMRWRLIPQCFSGSLV